MLTPICISTGAGLLLLYINKQNVTKALQLCLQRGLVLLPYALFLFRTHSTFLLFLVPFFVTITGWIYVNILTDLSPVSLFFRRNCRCCCWVVQLTWGLVSSLWPSAAPSPCRTRSPQVSSAPPKEEARSWAWGTLIWNTSRRTLSSSWGINTHHRTRAHTRTHTHTAVI